MSDVEEPKEVSKPKESEQDGCQKEIHPNIEAFLNLFARWTIEELHIKKGGNNERDKKDS